MSNPSEKKLTLDDWDYTFHSEYPGSDVEVNEVFLSFRNDYQACQFEDWLHEEGWNQFRAFLARQGGDT